MDIEISGTGLLSFPCFKNTVQVLNQISDAENKLIEPYFHQETTAKAERQVPHPSYSKACSQFIQTDNAHTDQGLTCSVMFMKEMSYLLIKFVFNSLSV